MQSSSFFGNRPSVNIQSMFKDSAIDPSMQQHLVKVYASLAGTLLCAALGSYAHLQFNIGGILSTFAVIGLLWYLGTDRNKADYQRRLAVLFGIGFFKGASIGPLIQQALYVDPSIILTAFLGTTTVFACFTLSAMFSRRRSMLALGGMLSSGVSFLMLLSLANMFFRSVMVFNVALYAGLFIFCGYVLYDTQIIIERAASGDRDFVWHSVELFIDFVAIFVRLVIILMKNSEKRDNRRKNRR